MSLAASAGRHEDLPVLFRTIFFYIHSYIPNPWCVYPSSFPSHIGRSPCSFSAVGRLVPGTIFGVVWVKMKDIASQTCIFRLNLVILNTGQLTHMSSFWLLCYFNLAICTSAISQHLVLGLLNDLYKCDHFLIFRPLQSATVQEGCDPEVWNRLSKSCSYILLKLKRLISSQWIIWCMYFFKLWLKLLNSMSTSLHQSFLCFYPLVVGGMS